MKVVIDCLGAPAKSGGMQLHAREVVRTWAEDHPGDRLIVVGAEWARDEFADLRSVRVVRWQNDRVAMRMFGQLVLTAVVFRLLRADFLVSLSPIVSPMAPWGRRVCFQHDWRHMKNPEEFSSAIRLYRRLWVRSASSALFNACISDKAVSETTRYAPAARTKLVVNGWDHARRWSVSPEQGDYFVTFGHHNNKRADLVVRALGTLAPLDRPRLIVVGVKQGSHVQEAVAASGVASSVEVMGYVSDEEYQSLVAGSRGVVLASSDEGFGLPLAEAHYLGKMAVTTLDSGVGAIFPNCVEAEPTEESLGEALRSAAGSMPELNVTDVPTWSASVRTLRQALAVRGRRRS